MTQPADNQQLIELLESIVKAVSSNREDSITLFNLAEKLMPMFSQINGIVKDQQEQIQLLQKQVNDLRQARYKGFR